jgi:hypothetical protein
MTLERCSSFSSVEGSSAGLGFGCALERARKVGFGLRFTGYNLRFRSYDGITRIPWRSVEFVAVHGGNAFVMPEGDFIAIQARRALR